MAKKQGAASWPRRVGRRRDSAAASWPRGEFLAARWPRRVGRGEVTPTHFLQFDVNQLKNRKSVLIATKMNRRWICNDVWMDILPSFDHAQLGLKLALLSPRFNALVDKHFDGKSELTIWRQIIICKAIGAKPKFSVLIDGKFVGFPLPDRPMHNKIRFKDLQINYLDHSVITFLRSNKRIWDRMGTSVTFYLYSLDADDEPIWEAFTREIWPIFATNIRHLQFTYAYHLDDLRRLISPTILTDLVDQLVSINSYLFPDVIADDGPNATAGQALSKWLNTPRNGSIAVRTMAVRTKAFRTIASKRGHNKLAYQGFVYQHHLTHNDASYWFCELKKTATNCPGRAIYRDGIVTVSAEHKDHAPSAINVQVQNVRTNMRTNNTRDVPRTVVNECLAGASNEVIANLPKIATLEQAISRKRKRQGVQLNIPHTLADVFFPEELRYTRTHLAENYVLADTGAEDQQRIILLGSATDVERLTRCDTWLADGTFRCAPEIIFQVYSIHGLYRNRVVPLVIALLPNKTRCTYERAIQLLLDSFIVHVDPRLDQSRRRPSTILIDFEKAAENAFRAKIPTAILHGCWFHLSQAHWRSVQSHDMQMRYSQDTAYETAIKKFSALAFCEVDDVVARFNDLAERFIQRFGDTQQHQNFLEYLENTWIGRQRRTPAFSLNFWNCKDITELHLPRTTNGVESWHARLQQTFTSPHPTFFTFVEGLLNENVRANAICVKLESGESIPLYTRIEYRQANERLLNILRRYNEYLPDDYLAACANYVHF
ncbi:hypothetical protein niasHT_039143 [Heterodera trifolii]|uniref:MULE transposase domain-containing protein n=1 Tax=Heterodera trifolii TaxID=157864 RepID=A0ABD2HVD4_9BILA